ncbi:hypothetical protein QQF64_006414, partial [Cirrhinus molitorella]
MSELPVKPSRDRSTEGSLARLKYMFYIHITGYYSNKEDKRKSDVLEYESGSAGVQIFDLRAGFFVETQGWMETKEQLLKGFCWNRTSTCYNCQENKSEQNSRKRSTTGSTSQRTNF